MLISFFQTTSVSPYCSPARHSKGAFVTIATLWKICKKMFGLFEFETNKLNHILKCKGFIRMEKQT